ncbi:MAG: TIGR00730 family Rossman fold protein [Chitinophagaceae bacterium]|nr:TIGR00730 family Rossman fold protein [Chitinophagaceae bacterium]MCW5926640.1 TIGR00730 family Rossman fold protein [Chitinophagaceae bacterium]
MNTSSVAVFCGSREGDNPIYMQHSALLAQLLADAGIAIIYGGGNRGIMGAVANTALSRNGKVTGVMPMILAEREQEHTGLTRLIVTEGMHERKKTMYELCDAAIILPGGYGTLDELFEMLTWNQLSIHNKRIYVLNTNGFYNYLHEHMEHMEAEGFLYTDVENRISFFDTPEKLMEGLV